MKIEKVFKYYQQNKITQKVNESILHARESTLHNAHGVQLYQNNAHTLLLHILSILNSDWLQHAHSVGRVYECLILEKNLIAGN